MREDMSINVRRSPLGRARGVGAGQSGVEHWRAERITSIALVPLTLWFIYAMLQLVGAPQEAVAGWASNPINAVMLLTLVVFTFHHMQLGLQVVYEDYVSNKALMASMILGTKAVCLLLGLLSSIAVLKLALS
ncbi:MAG: succinate dehydrogenase, hydrophobic membrane anchor protein [Gemmatimonadaceae bacterium]|nr:succinate dehydrogenase, hydrophobic membrane anchor protein [Acetobacteraceae bacterium]